MKRGRSPRSSSRKPGGSGARRGAPRPGASRSSAPRSNAGRSGQPRSGAARYGPGSGAARYGPVRSGGARSGAPRSGAAPRAAGTRAAFRPGAPTEPGSTRSRAGRGGPTRPDRGSRAPDTGGRKRYVPKASTFSTRGGAPAGPGLDRLINRQPWDSLIPHLLKAGVSAEATIEQLKAYARLLIEWTRGVSNLIGRNDEQRIVERHISESIAPAAWLKASPAIRWLDFGSGAGLPAIPLAMTGVGPHWPLVESRRMKTLFMRKATESLGLKNIEIVVARLEYLLSEPERKGAYHGFTSRATLALGPTLVLAAHFVAPGGVAFLWKGSQRENEMADDPRWKEFWEFDGLLGVGDGQTVVARFVRKP